MTQIIEKMKKVLNEINFSIINNIYKNLFLIFLLAGNIAALFQLVVLIY